MLNSAMLDPRRARRLQQIHAHACRLVLERGFSGFTMDELAEAVGCSRRTLFNYVPDKASAVIGPWDQEQLRPLLAEFLAGGPTGVLHDDGIATIQRVLTEVSTQDPASDDPDLTGRAVRADPRVMQLVSERLELVTQTMADAVCEREGWQAGDLRAATLAAQLLALLLVALHSLEGLGEACGGHQLVDAFARVVDADRQARALRRPTPPVD